MEKKKPARSIPILGEIVQPTAAKDRARQLKFIDVEFAGLTMLLTTGNAFEILKGLPEGAQVAHAAINTVERSIRLYVHHPDFEELDPDLEMPGVSVDIQQLTLGPDDGPRIDVIDVRSA